MRRFEALVRNHGASVPVRAVSAGVLITWALTVGTAVPAFAGSAATKLCIPKAARKPVIGPTKGRCPRKYKLVELGGTGEKGGVGQVEALQFVAIGAGTYTGGQVVSVPAGSYGAEAVAPENTISYGPVNVLAHGVVAEIHVSGRESLGAATSDVHVSNLAGTQVVGGVTGKVIPKGKVALLELTHIGFQAGTDLYLQGGRLYSAKGGTYWIKVGISLPPR
jgi:hypothetical protein